MIKAMADIFISYASEDRSRVKPLAKAIKVMAANKTKHRNVTCAACHYERHGMIPACQKCHGQWPHPSEILNKFTICKECHGVAHDLMATDYITNIFKMK